MVLAPGSLSVIFQGVVGLNVNSLIGSIVLLVMRVAVTGQRKICRRVGVWGMHIWKLDTARLAIAAAAILIRLVLRIYL